MENLKKNSLAVSALVVIVAASVGGGYSWGLAKGRQIPKKVAVSGVTNLEPGNVNTDSADFGQFWEVWQLIKESYLRDKDVKAEDKVYGATRGLVNSLGDPYSEFFPPEDSKKFEEDIRGNFSGIGAEIGIRKEQLVIVAPLKGTPAEQAGLKAGDKILAINASSTEGIGVDDAVRLIRGPRNTDVTLNIFRDGWEKPKDIVITRDNIQVPTVDFEMKDGGIAYVGLRSFNANAGSLFADAAVKALQNDAKGIVLDLRNDPGGYLDAAVNVAGWFFQQGTLVVSEAEREGVTQELKTYGNGALKDIPLVVLINQGSASASEILAGALRDNRRVKLVGEQSFGKGTVQEILPLSGDASVKLTVAHWVLPSGKVLENGGLAPDVEVKTDDENTKDGKDPQLEKALEILKKQISN